MHALQNRSAAQGQQRKPYQKIYANDSARYLNNRRLYRGHYHLKK
jgi:hypothetical protein